MRIHPFKPLVLTNTRKLLIGTLPPEDVKFYFSNSSNTRLWDILFAIKNKTNIVGRGGNAFTSDEKESILEFLGLGIADIVLGYERDDYFSTKDKHINPKRYKNLLQLAIENDITELLFVYQNAYKWFLHSLDNVDPVRIRKLKTKYSIGEQKSIEFKGQIIKCILLPAPLNRGSKGQTLDFKLKFYNTYISK